VVVNGHDLSAIAESEPRIIPAFIVEELCGLFLAVSACGLVTRKGWAWRTTLAALRVAAAGVILGLTALALGRGPRTVSNDLYHNLMLVLLIASLVLL
jgi:hypothetical protein